MKFSTPIAASLLVVTSALIVSLPQPSSAQECTGPFRECANSVGAQCSRDASGQQRIIYSDGGGRVTTFERCVGRIFQAAGHPDPYKTGVQTYGELTVPSTEILVPHSEP